VINIGALWRYWKLFLSVLAFFNSLIAAMLACKKKNTLAKKKMFGFRRKMASQEYLAH
jgi:hypothetical protein